jgi:hypothetical protein
MRHCQHAVNLHVLLGPQILHCVTASMEMLSTSLAGQRTLVASPLVSPQMQRVNARLNVTGLPVASLTTTCPRKRLTTAKYWTRPPAPLPVRRDKAASGLRTTLNRSTAYRLRTAPAQGSRQCILCLSRHRLPRAFWRQSRRPVRYHLRARPLPPSAVLVSCQAPACHPIISLHQSTPSL